MPVITHHPRYTPAGAEPDPVITDPANTDPELAAASEGPGEYLITETATYLVTALSREDALERFHADADRDVTCFVAVTDLEAVRS